MAYAEAKSEEHVAASTLKGFSVEIVDGPQDSVSYRLKREFHVGPPKRESFDSEDAELLARKVCKMLGVDAGDAEEEPEPDEAVQIATQAFTRALKGKKD